MINELWNRFPRLLEGQVNGLLDSAKPSRMKAFYLYKTCKVEGLWSDDFNRFQSLLEEYFSLPRQARVKSAFDCYLKKPMDYNLHREFYLDFRTAEVNEKSIYEVASWAHNIMRIQKKDIVAVTSMDVLTRTLNSITRPGFYSKAQDIAFEDFCASWRKTVSKLYGQKYDSELNLLICELDEINARLKLEEHQTEQSGLQPAIPLSLSEITWVKEVYKAALDRKRVPRFPSPDGSTKRMLMELERVVLLYQIVEVTSLPELLKHRENIRTTLLDRCDYILGLKQSAA